MQVEVIDKRQIIKRFKENGHNLSSAAFTNVIEYLYSQDQENMGGKLNELIEKINKISIFSNDQVTEDLVKSCIISTQYKKGYQSIDDIIGEKFKQSIFAVSPYEFMTQEVCIEKPPRELFEYNPQSKSKMFLRRLQKAKNNIKKPSQQTIIGILFQKFDQTIGEMRLYVQSLNSEIKLDISQMVSSCPFILNGCVYIIKGSQKGKDLIFKVDQIRLPLPNTSTFDFSQKKFMDVYKKAGVSLQNLKTKQIVKKKLGCYGIHWFEKPNKLPILVIGNIILNAQSLLKIRHILNMLPSIQCIVLMLSKGKHSQFDLNFDGRLVYVIPDVEEDGPSALPRIPIFRYKFKGATILTNPCKVSFFGTNVTFFNYQMNTHLHSKNILKKEEVNSADRLKNMGEFLFGQANLSADINNYWEQEPYMDVYSNQTIMISDGSCPQGQLSLTLGGRIASVGHFQRQSSFILYYPLLQKNQIQLSSLE